MPRVAVVGAGIAGLEAARVAAGRGARVVVFEAGDQVPVPRSSWPSILESGERRLSALRDASPRLSGTELQLGQRVSKVGGDLSVVVGGRKSQFDAVVVSTGSAPLQERLEGTRKRGVHILDSQAAYAALGERLGEYGKAVVSGSGPVALEVVEKLRSRRLAVSMVAPGGVLPTLNGAPRKVVLDALSSLGVQVVESKPEKVVGVDRVEAVVASEEVVPGDCFVLLPKLAPSLPEVQASIGRSGGIVVDDRMQSSLRSAYSAGDCAEVSVGRTTMSVMFESSARLMGAVAGANAAGGAASGVVVGSFFMELFGVGLASAGLGLSESVALGLEVSEASGSWKGELACSLVYARGRGTVVGVQLAGKSAARFAESLPLIVSAGMTLSQLAYQESPISSDISPIEETARAGVQGK